MTTKGTVSASEYLEKLIGPPTIGGILQAYRLAEDFTQAKVAKKLGISKAHLSQLERGHKFLSPERAHAFAKKLGYSPALFVKLSLQDQITRAKLPYKVMLEAA